MLQNTRVASFTISELLRKNQQGEGEKLPPPHPESGLRSNLTFIIDNTVILKSTFKIPQQL